MAETITSLLTDLIRCIEDRNWGLAITIAGNLKRELSVYLFKNYGRKDGLVEALDMIVNTAKKRCSDEAKQLVCEMWVKELIKDLSKFGIFFYKDVESNSLPTAIYNILSRLDELTFKMSPPIEYRTKDIIEEESKIEAEIDDLLNNLYETIINAKLDDFPYPQTLKMVLDRVSLMISDARMYLRKCRVNPRDSKNKQNFLDTYLDLREALRHTIDMIKSPNLCEIKLQLLSQIFGYNLKLIDSVEESGKGDAEQTEVEESIKRTTLQDLIGTTSVPEWVDDEWMTILSNPTVAGMIMGHIGTGKSALMHALAEAMHAIHGMDVYMIWSDLENPPPMKKLRELLPKYYHVVVPEDEAPEKVLDKIPNNVVIVIDEAYAAFSSLEHRAFRGVLVKVLQLRRHRKHAFFFVSHVSSIIDKKTLFTLDYLFIKELTEFEVEQERKEIQKYVKRARDYFVKGLNVQDKKPFVFVVNPKTGEEKRLKFQPASFWCEELSTIFGANR